MLSGLMKKLAMAGDDAEEQSPEEASLSDLIGMLEDVIAKKGMTKKKPVAMSLEIEAGEPKEGEEAEGEMMGDGSPFEKSKVDMEDDEEEMKKAKFFK